MQTTKSLATSDPFSMTDFFATAPRHLESLLADELLTLGMAAVKETRGGARFSGALADAYRVCLWSRVANRVLLPLAQFPAEASDDLYAGTTAIPWEEHIPRQGSFAVHFQGAEGGISHSHYGALRVKDAVVDRCRNRQGDRPNVDRDSPDVLVQAYLHQGQVTLSLDLAGESLHLRGYRRLGSAAPLKENLAAAILLRSSWPELSAGGAAFLDPLCGSGTLCIEGALIAADIAPSLGHRHWGMTGWLGHEAGIWDALLTEARERRLEGLARLTAGGISIRGYDRDPAAIRAAQDNRERAGLRGNIHFECRELSQAVPGREGDLGLVVANPPYGERLGEAATLPGLYALLGQVLRERFLGWRAAILTGNPELGRSLGLRARNYHSLYNGPLPCRLLHFEVREENFFSAQPRPLPPEQRGPGAEMLANRLRKNLKHLEKWRQREQVDCYRLYDADLPEYNLALDLYTTLEGERIANVQEYEAPPSIDPRDARRRLREALGVIPEVLGIQADRLFPRIRRRQRGTDQYERLDNRRRFFQVREQGLKFLVNFEDYLDTGIFLDHRLVRRLIGELAGGQHFLNLFGYTGTASVHAAAGGALSTTTVDLSRTYLDWAGRNLACNGFTGRGHELIQADCLTWPREVAGRRRWGLILLDPPSFSSSKRMTGTLDVQRDHVALIRDALKLLGPGGTLIFSNNLRRFRLDREALAAALATPRGSGHWPARPAAVPSGETGVEIRDITAATLPRDFARNPRIHRVWRIEQRSGTAN
jgi:23S rRNA (guanine2445-N2)-methyltransferase / 23S rRNA (guanine2069-N7)-methyltransferase